MVITQDFKITTPTSTPAGALSHIKDFLDPTISEVCVPSQNLGLQSNVLIFSFIYSQLQDLQVSESRKLNAMLHKF